MKEKLLDILKCPGCGGRLKLGEGHVADKTEIQEGKLACTDCSTVFGISKGVPRLIIEDEHTKKIQSEIDGWVEFAKEEGWYDLPEECYLLLPRKELEGTEARYWKKELFEKFRGNVMMYNRKADWFDSVMKSFDPQKQKRVLDLGAGKCWASRHFSERGAEVVAMDVLDDDNIGLGRCRTYFEHLGIYFERVMGDFENMPFEDGSFDMVFCSASLHHSRDLKKLLLEFNRVLKPGGRAVAIDEPFRNIMSKEEDVLKTRGEIDFGINERVYSYLEYRSAFKKAGFSPKFKTHFSIQDTEAKKELIAASGTLRSKAASPFLKYAPFKNIINAYVLLFGEGLLMVEGIKSGN